MAGRAPALPARFVVEAELGRGAMGRVLLARDRKLDRRVAVKLVLEGEGDLPDPERLAEEARSLAPLRHEAIVSLLDFAGEGETPYIVFEYVEGENLARHLTAHGPLALPRLFAWGRRIAAGLAYAHEQGILHRDLKAENVLLSPSGPKIADFGLALRHDRSRVLTRTGLIMGTPSYMAPELVRGGKAAVASEVYAAGVLLFAMATGRLPFEGDDVGALLRAHCEDAPPSPARWRPDLPPAFSRLVLDCLAKDPDARPRSLAVVEARLAEAELVPAAKRSTPTRNLVRPDASAGETRPVTSPPPPRGSPRPWRSIAVIGLAFGVIAVLAMRREKAITILAPPRIEATCESARILLALSGPIPVRWELFGREQLLSRGRTDATSAPEILLKALVPNRDYRIELLVDETRNATTFRTLPVTLTGPLHVTAYRRHLLVEVDTALGSRLTFQLRLAGRSEELHTTVAPSGKTTLRLPETTPSDTAVDWMLSHRDLVLARGRCPLFPPSAASPILGIGDATERTRSVAPRHGFIHWMDGGALFLDTEGWFQFWERVPWRSNDSRPLPSPLRLGWLYPCAHGASDPIVAHGSGAWLPLDRERIFFVANTSFHDLRLGELRPATRRARWSTGGASPRLRALRPDWSSPGEGERHASIHLDRSNLSRHLSPVHEGRTWLFLSQRESFAALEVDLEGLASTRTLVIDLSKLADRPSVTTRDGVIRGRWSGPPPEFAMQTWIVPCRPVFFDGACWLVACPMDRKAFDDSLGVLIRLPLPGRPGIMEPIQAFRTDPSHQFLTVSPDGLLVNGHHGLDLIRPDTTTPRPFVSAAHLPHNPHVPGEPCPLVGSLFDFQGERHGFLGVPRKMPALFEGGRYDVSSGIHLHLFDGERLGARRSKEMIYEAEVAARPGLQTLIVREDRVYGASVRHVFVLDGKTGRSGSCQPDPSGRIKGVGVSREGIISTVDGEGRIFFIPDELLLADGQELLPLPHAAKAQ